MLAAGHGSRRGRLRSAWDALSRGTTRRTVAVQKALVDDLWMGTVRSIFGSIATNWRRRRVVPAWLGRETALVGAFAEECEQRLCTVEEKQSLQALSTTLYEKLRRRCRNWREALFECPVQMSAAMVLGAIITPNERNG